MTAQRLQRESAKNEFRETSVKQSAINKIQYELALELEALIREKNRRTEAQNRVTLARNREVEKENEKVEERNTKRKQQKKAMDSAARVAEETFKALEAEARKPVEITRPEKTQPGNGVQDTEVREVARVERVYRSFTISNLGIWNSDKVQPPPISFFAATADFKNEGGDSLDIQHLGAMIRGMNGVIIMNSNALTLVQGTDMMIWGVVNNQFACLDYKAYNALKTSPAVKQYTFVMKLVPLGRNNYQYVRAFVGQKPLP